MEPLEDAIKLQSMPDYDHLEKYSLQGMEQGNDEMDAVINLFKKIQTGGR